MKRFSRTRVALAVSGLGLALAAGHAQGAAFALQENSASGLGNAFAGGAAAAEDSSTVWSNPAGIVRLASPQVAAAVHLLTPSIKFSNDGSVAAAFQPLGHAGGDAGTLNVIPNLYITAPINRELSVGLGVNAPFGLVTDYGDGWLGRFQAMKSEIKTMNINPTLAWRVSDRVSVGAGANYQRIDATLTNRLNYPAVGASQLPAAAVPGFVAATSGLEGGVRIEGDDTAWGWNVGVLFDLDSRSRIGAQYRSSVKYNLGGTVRFDLPSPASLPAAVQPLATALNAGLANGDVNVRIELPAIANASYFRQLNDRWDIMTDVQWTGWSSFKEIRVVRANGAVLGTPTPENFKDAWRISAGANYRYSDGVTLRGGFAWDQSPANDTDRTPRLPDKSRIWYSIGAQYAMSPKLKFDLGFTYIVSQQASMNQNAGSTAGNGLIKGTYDPTVTILSGQVTYSF